MTMPGTADEAPGAAGWGAGGPREETMAANDGEDEPTMEEEKTVVYMYITCLPGSQINWV